MTNCTELATLICYSLSVMSAEFEKLATNLKCKGYDVAAGHTFELVKFLNSKGLIPASLNTCTNGTVFQGTFAEQIKQYRLRPSLKLSQRRLAEKAGVDHATISKIESGKTLRPAIGTVVVIVEALKLDTEQSNNLYRSVPNDQPIGKS